MKKFFVDFFGTCGTHIRRRVGKHIPEHPKGGPTMTIAVLRTVILYLLLVAAVRLMGKRQLGELQRRFKGWKLCAFSADTCFEQAYGRRATRRRRYYNGRIECEYRIFE